jgi:hypothetical protein
LHLRKSADRGNDDIDVVELLRTVLDPEEDTVVSVTRHECGDAKMRYGRDNDSPYPAESTDLGIKISKSIGAIIQSDVARSVAVIRRCTSRIRSSARR